SIVVFEPVGGIATQRRNRFYGKDVGQPDTDGRRGAPAQQPRAVRTGVRGCAGSGGNGEGRIARVSIARDQRWDGRLVEREQRTAGGCNRNRVEVGTIARVTRIVRVQERGRRVLLVLLSDIAHDIHVDAVVRCPTHGQPDRAVVGPPLLANLAVSRVSQEGARADRVRTCYSPEGCSRERRVGTAEVEYVQVAVLMVVDAGRAYKELIRHHCEIVVRSQFHVVATAIQEPDGALLVAVRLLGEQFHRAAYRVHARERPL